MAGIKYIGSIIPGFSEFSLEMYIYPVTGSNAILVILLGTCDRIRSCLSVFGFYGNGIRGKADDGSVRSPIFQFFCFVEFIYYL